MMPFETRHLSLLLSLLLACTPTLDPLSTGEGEQEEPVASRGARTPLVTTSAPAWQATGQLAVGRAGHTATLLPNGQVLVVGGNEAELPSASAELYDPATGSWSPAVSLTHARSGHTATPLPNGKVLIAGGNDGAAPLAFTELYDPATGSSSSGALAQARENHTATLLPNGKVLIVGGNVGAAALASAELYDPATGSSSVGALSQARRYHTTTLLPDGKALVVGGRGTDGDSLASAEKYDPATGSWSSTGLGSLAQPRDRHTAALLPDGRLLVVGGYMRIAGSHRPVGSAEVYDPATRAWSSAGALTMSRFNLTATLLRTGKLLVVGGKSYELEGLVPEVVAELYDLATGVWSSAGKLKDARRDHTATLLPDGKVLIVGGGDTYGNVFDTVEVYDPSTNIWSSSKERKLEQARSGHTATLLLDGSVLVVGGFSHGGGVSTIEVCNSNGACSSTSRLLWPRYGHTATLLPDGKVLIVGGSDNYFRLASAEVYDPLTKTLSFTGSLQQARMKHTATLLPDGKVLVVAGMQSSINPLATAEVYDPATGSWSSARPLKRARHGHTATLQPDGKVLVAGGIDGSDSFLATTEVYDPASGTRSSAPSLIQARSFYTTTLLPDGKVLAVGGSGFPTAEVYDPATESWSSTGSLQQTRLDHTATLLPGGGVLVVGGITYDNTLLGSAELYRESAGKESWRPRLTGGSPSQLEPGNSFTVRGEQLRGISEASGGNTQASPTHYPLLSLSSVQNGQWVPLLGQDVSDTSLQVTVPPLPSGHYLLHVTLQGLTASQFLSLGNTTAPDTDLKNHSPSTPEARDSTASFSFSSGAVDLAGFECSLDEDGFTSCSSPKAYASLADGPHTFSVRARDLAGNVDPTPAGFSWRVDTTAPETGLDTASAPLALTLHTSARFSFLSEEGTFFECRLDGAAFTACSNPQDYSSLQDGRHSFQVRARDPLGNVDATPVEHVWTVDTVAPSTDINSAPQALTRSTSAGFSFRSEPGTTFECRLDEAAFEACPNPKDYSSLRDKEYTLQVRARDLAGNADPTPAEYQWRVDTTSPNPPVIQKPRPDDKLLDSPRFFSGTAEPGSTVKLLVDGVPLGEVPANKEGHWQITAAPLTRASHKVTVEALDRVGNVSERSHMTFTIVQRSHYGMGCSAGPSSWMPWPWALLALGLLRRRRSPPHRVPLPE